MTARYLSLPTTLRDLRTAAAHIEQTLVHLAELGQLLDRIHQRLDMLSPHRSDIGRAPAPFALLFLEQPNFGRVMRRIREALGLTREHLARLSGLATSTVRNLETRTGLAKPQTCKVQLQALLAFFASCLEFDEKGDKMALASVVPLYLGLRASEVLKRQVRDVDAGGSLLWIDGGKTKNARRHLKIEARALQERLLVLTQGRHPCPHSFRGLWATLSVESRAASSAVAASLGHGSFAMTARHYAQPEAVANARSARVVDMLQWEGNSNQDMEPEQIIERLSPSALAKLAEVLYKTVPVASRKDSVAV